MYKKNTWLHFRANPAEREVLEEIARQEALNMSEAVRQLVRAEAKRRGISLAIQTDDGRMEADRD